MKATTATLPFPVIPLSPCKGSEESQDERENQNGTVAIKEKHSLGLCGSCGLFPGTRWIRIAFFIFSSVIPSFDLPAKSQ